MTKTPKIEGTAEAWEDGSLGCTEEHVGKASGQEMDDFNAAMASRPVSIRLKESMIEDLKFFAGLEGLGYQTLIKNLLQRFIDGEYKRVTHQLISEKAKAGAESEEEISFDDDKAAAA